MKKLFLSTFLPFYLSTFLFAAFNDVGVNARPAGMGDTFVAVGDDVNGVFYNPAAIADSKNKQVIFSYRDFYGLGLVSQNYVGFCIPDKMFNVALSFHRTGTTQDVEFDYTEDTYIITLAGQTGIIKNSFIGGNFKFFRVTSESNASGYGIDVGLLCRFMREKFGLGFAVQNLNTSDILWDTGTKNTLEANYRLGLSFNPTSDITIALDNTTTDNLCCGVEAKVLRNVLELRTGIKSITNENKTLAGGMSVMFKNLQFDYAVTKHPFMDWTQFFSMMVKW